MKKCPPGVICFENFTIFILFIILCIFCYLFFSKNHNQNINVSTNLRSTSSNLEQGQNDRGFFSFLPSYPYNNLPTNDILFNHNPHITDLSNPITFTGNFQTWIDFTVTDYTTNVAPDYFSHILLHCTAEEII